MGLVSPKGGDGIDSIRHLGTKQSDLPEVGPQSVVSEVLSGKRKLNVRQVSALAKRFRLPADVFIQ